MAIVCSGGTATTVTEYWRISFPLLTVTEPHPGESPMILTFLASNRLMCTGPVKLMSLPLGTATIFCSPTPTVTSS